MEESSREILSDDQDDFTGQVKAINKRHQKK